MFGIGPTELVVILVIGLLVLGPRRLPEMARSLGKGLAEFRRASSDLRQSLALEDEPQRYSPPTSRPAQALPAEDEIAESSDDPAEGRKIEPPGAAPASAEATDAPTSVASADVSASKPPRVDSAVDDEA